MSFVTDELKTKQEELDRKVGKEGGYIFRESDTKTGVLILSSRMEKSGRHTMKQSLKWRIL